MKPTILQVSEKPPLDGIQASILPDSWIWKNY